MTRTTISARAFASAGVLAVGLLAVGLAGCRSDGGIGRRDSQRSLSLTLDQIEIQYERDMKATRANMSKMSDWFSGEVNDPWSEVDRTVGLYLEGDARRR